MVKVQIQDKELKDRIKKLMLDTDASNLASRLYVIAADAAQIVADEISNSAESKNVPSDIQRDIFSTVKPKRFSDGRRQITQLAGIRLRGRSRPFARAYREWRAKTSRTKIRINKRKGIIQNRGTVMAGQLIGMSLATMFEYGTSKMRPRPFVRPAIRSARDKVRFTLTEGVKEVIGL